LYVYTRSVGIWGSGGDQDFYASKQDDLNINVMHIIFYIGR